MIHKPKLGLEPVISAVDDKRRDGAVVRALVVYSRDHGFEPQLGPVYQCLLCVDPALNGYLVAILGKVYRRCRGAGHFTYARQGWSTCRLRVLITLTSQSPNSQ